MKSVICVFPGSNCDRDMAVALEKQCGHKPCMVWHKETELPEVDLIVLPGGFSYGDYLRAGAIAAHSPIMPEIIQRAKKGVAILGVCNGFQILTETGLLPGTLMCNWSRKFICREIFVKTETHHPPFTSLYRLGEPQRLYIAHHHGSYQADQETLKRLEGQERIALRYCNSEGHHDEQSNPNGSASDIAAIVNAAGNVFGMMPHPERNADPALSSSLSGAALFQSLDQAYP